MNDETEQEATPAAPVEGAPDMSENTQATEQEAEAANEQAEATTSPEPESGPEKDTDTTQDGSQ